MNQELKPPPKIAQYVSGRSLTNLPALYRRGSKHPVCVFGIVSPFPNAKKELLKIEKAVNQWPLLVDLAKRVSIWKADFQNSGFQGEGKFPELLFDSLIAIAKEAESLLGIRPSAADVCRLCGSPDRDKPSDHLRTVYKFQDQLHQGYFKPRRLPLWRLEKGENRICSNRRKCEERQHLSGKAG